MEEPQQPTINTSIETDLSLTKVPELTQEEKERFLKSVLADKPYEETFSLFDGQMKVTVRSMTVAENNDVVTQIMEDRDKGIASDNDAYFITIASYRLAQSLVSIDGVPFSMINKDTFVATPEAPSYILAKVAPLKLWSTAKLAIFLDAFKLFESKVLRLTNAVQTVNFWKASA
jgi:hypothetical protein